MAAKDNKIFETVAYKDFELKHNRHLNMLADTVSSLSFCFISYFIFVTLGP